MPFTFIRLATLFLGFVPLLSLYAAEQQIPAFPGAEGFGAWAKGGRGGDVYTVTTLKAEGPGSFAEAVATAPAQGRTIVFAVSGNIVLPARHRAGLTIKANKLTIAGQTAPGGGICFSNNTMWISGSDLIFRHVRWRYGKQATHGDCVDIDRNSSNTIFDHCDVMFGTDENFSFFNSSPENLTFQWSANAWGLQTHSCGGLWSVNHVTAHHTLWAHNHTRNPKVIEPVLLDWTNNVSFGWDLGFHMAGGEKGGVFKINICGSTFAPGGRAKEAIYGGVTAPDGSLPFRLHMSDTAQIGGKNGPMEVTKNNYELTAGTLYQKQSSPFPQTKAANPAASRDPVVGVPVTVDDRLTAYKKVISQAGALRLEIDPAEPLRDEVTSRLIQDVIAQKRRIISDPAELGLGRGVIAKLASKSYPPDADHDGMPDFWEKALGWDPAGDDHNKELESSGGMVREPTFFPAKSPAGYTRLEEYLHFLASPHGTVAKSTAAQPTSIAVDLKKFTSGFSKGPVFKISNVIGGIAILGGEVNSIATFKPAPNHIGRAKFDFTVADADGSTWTQTCVILVDGAAAPFKSATPR